MHESFIRVQCSSHVTQYPSNAHHGMASRTRPMAQANGDSLASGTSSMRSMTTQMERSTCPKLPAAEYYDLCRGCRRTWENARALRYHRTALQVRDTAFGNDTSSAVRRNITSEHLAEGLMEFRPIFQLGTSEVHGLLPFITYF